jgi:hypothetical protein
MELKDIKIPFVVLVTWFLRFAISIPIGMIIIGAVSKRIATQEYDWGSFYGVYNMIYAIGDPYSGQYWSIVYVVAIFAVVFSIFLFFAKAMRWVNADSYEDSGDVFKKW